MKRPTWLYVPLVLLFALTIAVLAIHSNRVFSNLNKSIESYGKPRLPFTIYDGRATNLRHEALTAGLRSGDRAVALNGKEITDNSVITAESERIINDEQGNITVERKDGGGQTSRHEIAFKTVRPTALEFAGSLTVNLLFLWVFPVISLLFAFYVVFVRPFDPLAWVLLFLLVGVGSFGLEGAKPGDLVYFYRSIFFGLWGLAALLFGIYFPERWIVDKKIPWAKWLFIVPLGINAIFIFAANLATFFGFQDASRQIYAPVRPFGGVFFILTMLAIGLFFAAIGYKSGTLENSDSRRRLRILNVGTMLAMTPPFLIIVIGAVRGLQGSFFDVVPTWFAIIALLSMLLFPLTMAYVIIVHRAMDVSVVIRQGLQYALAQNGVKVLQLVLLMAVVLGVIWIFRNYEGNVAAQIGFVAAGFALIPLIETIAKRLRVWIDRRFFREAYNAEQILSDLSEEVRTMVETKPLLETVSNKISQSLHVPKVALLLIKDGLYKPAYALGFEDAPPVSFPESGVTIEKLKKNEPVVVYQDDKESWINTEDLNGEREVLEKLDSQLLLPVGAKAKLSGFLSLSPKRSEEPYSPNDLRLLKSVAAQTGLALENSRLTEAIVAETAQRERLNREIEIAREVQERLFPQDLPKIKGLDYYGGCRPALGVGGDYYDFFELEHGKFGIAIGDVSGKGIGASLMMASLQASLRGQAIHFDDDLATLMSNVNRLVYETSTSNRYATFFYSQYDPKTRKLTYVNAGHNPPFLFRKTDEDYELLRLDEGGAVVGMLPPMLINYSQGEIQMQSGDLLIGFTDGISEAMNPQDEEWGEELMIEAIKERIELPSSEMLTYLVEQADKFANGAKQHDDMTLIIVRVV